MAAITPKKDVQTVTSNWESVATPIHGFAIKWLPPNEDERGELCEIYRLDWGFHSEPVVQVYQVMVRPKKVKGWVAHQKQDDRIFMSQGTLRWALFDNRPDSPTYKKLHIFVVSERHRATFVIPRGVFHAVQNIGEENAYFINLPTRAYDYKDPDKLRLPVKNDLIPFAFEDTLGW
jgi:dTDP-4-dehydrorhamnose 3,5-epimerase